MNITRESSGNLVVTSVSTYVHILLGLAVAGGIWACLAPIPAKQKLGWVGLAAIYVVALLAANERTTLVFDARRKVVRWQRDKLTEHTSGEIALSAIVGLSIERDFRSAAPSMGRGGARRLILLTSDGPVPLTTGFSGWGRAPENVGREIQLFVHEVTGSDIPLHMP